MLATEITLFLVPYMGLLLFAAISKFNMVVPGSRDNVVTTWLVQITKKTRYFSRSESFYFDLTMFLQSGLLLI